MRLRESVIDSNKYMADGQSTTARQSTSIPAEHTDIFVVGSATRD